VVVRVDDVQSELSETTTARASRGSAARRLTRAALGALVASAGACDGRDRSAPSGAHGVDSQAARAGAAVSVVDSALPIAEALRRFRVGLPEVHELSGGARSRDALVSRFVRSIESGDTAALRELELTKSEFGYLVYPSSVYTRRPYEQQPDIVWMLARSAGERGYRRLIDRYGGQQLEFQDYACGEPPVSQGANRTWRECSARFRRPGGGLVRGRLFGAIIERDGQFKFVNYSNDL